MTDPDRISDQDADAAVDDTFAQELEEDVWAEDTSGPSLVGRMLAELGGTFILVFMGVGGALFFGLGDNGTLSVAFGFALGVMIAAIVFGGVSGAHLNPAVTVGVWLGGRFPGRDVAPYVLAQVVGATLAAGFLLLLLWTHPGASGYEVVRAQMSAASNGFADHSPASFPLVAGLLVEVVIAALLVAVVLAVTSVANKAGAAAAPFAIGLAVGFLVMIAIPFTNGALNPARATGTALWSDAWAIEQLWLFWVAPLIGAAISGLLFRAFGPEEDLIIIERVEAIEVVER